MKNFMTIIIFLFGIAIFTVSESQPSSSNFEVKNVSEELASQVGSGSIDEEFEEYPFEDYFEGTYLETECQDCLASATADECLEVHSDCLDLPDCSDWSSCVGWCEAYEGDDDCYFQCDESFIDNEDVEVDFRICVCEKCGMQCRALCDVEVF